MSEYAEEHLRMARKYPYDAPEEYHQPITGDWALDAARAVVSSLGGRQGIDYILHDVDIPTRREILIELADIIRTAAQNGGSDGSKRIG